MKNKLMVLGALLLAPGVSQADFELATYGGIGYESQNITIGSQDFDSSMLTFHAGIWTWEGIGFEVELGKNSKEDTAGDVSLTHSSLLRYGMRLETPPTDTGTVLYLLFGGAASTIDQQSNGNGTPGEDTFNGYHAGIGLGTMVNQHLLLDFSYNNYQVDKSFDISGLRVTMSTTFGKKSR